MKTFWESSLKNRLKIYTRIIGIPLVLFLLIGLIGFVGDLTSQYEFDQMQSEGRIIFESFRSRGGYEKPIYNGYGEEGNAWDYYRRALEKIKTIPPGDMMLLKSFLDGKEADATQVTSILLRGEEALEEVRRGLTQAKCFIPIEYERGEEAPLPDYMALRDLAILLVAHGRMEGDLGRSHEAVRDYLNAALFGQDIAGGDLTSLSHMLGLAYAGIAMKGMERDLVSFSFEREDLKEIATTLHRLASTWPILGEDLLAEVYMLPFSPEAMERKLRLSVSTGSITEQIIQNPFFFWWFFHLRSWSDLFSVNRAWLYSKNLPLNMMGDVIRAEKQTLHDLNLLREEWDKRGKERRNWLGVTIVPNPFSSAKRRMEGILKIRLRGVAALAQLHYLQHKSYPSDLNEVGVQSASGGEPLLIDPMTASPWKYRVFANGDSCEIYSRIIEEEPRISKITLGPSN